jgi:hypothetical protein
MIKLYAYRSALGGDAVVFIGQNPANPMFRWFWNVEPKPVYAINVKEVRHDALRTDAPRAPHGVGGSAPRRPV